MSRFSVFLTADAERDLADIHRWIETNRSRGQAEEFLDRMLERIDSLERFPARGPVPGELAALGIREFRQLLVQPYRMIYRISDQQVFVYLISDGRRDFQTLLERRLLNR
jgi:toxin ParE1/3/4